MILYPAIDLKDGQAVRLVHGDMDRSTVFNDDPAAQAREFIEFGGVVHRDGGVRFLLIGHRFSIPRGHKVPCGKPMADYARRPAKRGGIRRMIKVTGAHGQRGTAARPGSLSMASTMAVTPVLVSTIIGVVGDLALRSVWM